MDLSTINSSLFCTYKGQLWIHSDTGLWELFPYWEALMSYIQQIKSVDQRPN